MKVSALFNAKGPSQQARSVDQLKSKYENLKTRARKCAAENKQYWRGTGGGPSQEPDWDPVIEAILRVINEKTVCGVQNPHDSDSVINNPTDMNNGNIEVINQDECEEVFHHILKYLTISKYIFFSQIFVVMEDDKENAEPIVIGNFVS